VDPEFIVSLKMKFPLIALALSLSAVCHDAVWAASPEQNYLAARDAYIKAFHNGGADPDFDKHKSALADLETQLRRIIGPTTLKGFPAEGKIHLDTLSPEDEGFGLLDGLVYAIPLDEKGIDERASVVVTTKGLFEAWLRAHKTKWWNQDPLPQDLQAALRSDELYRQALSTDAAVVTFARLPVAKPSWARTAFGILATRTQDDIGSAPTEMDIVVIGNERVYVATAKIDVAVGPIAACETIRRQFKARAEDADRIYLRCFATHAHDENSFAAAVKQAQALVDALPAK
jgi:hypothetical protein